MWNTSLNLSVERLVVFNGSWLIMLIVGWIFSIYWNIFHYTDIFLGFNAWVFLLLVEFLVFCKIFFIVLVYYLGPSTEASWGLPAFNSDCICWVCSGNYLRAFQPSYFYLLNSGLLNKFLTSYIALWSYSPEISLLLALYSIFTSVNNHVS